MTADHTSPPNDPSNRTAEAYGSVLLENHHLVERLAQFNRERVPERHPYAKGGGAFGHFEVNRDVSAYTRADVFQPGRSTEVLVRFSTVAGERGSPDTWRDPRGFAIRFYTSEGNYDMVGNNTPIFFLRDPMKFPAFIRSQKRRPDNDLRDHDMQWNFWTLSPEAAHQVTWLMGHRGIPRTWRHMDGFSAHTYMWANDKGERFWVRYHFKSDQGIENFAQADADKMVATDPDYHRRDLWDAIEGAEHPRWTLKMQIMPFEDALSYRFNPFDVTKVLPHSDYPLIDVGTLTLDRNPTNFHSEIEQAAFEPSNLVPGIGPSPDKMLLGRMFAYPDAHRNRIGTNYNELPVNRPRAAGVRSYHPRDGYSAGGAAADTDWFGESAGWHVDRDMQRAADVLHVDDDDWGQAGTFVRTVLDEDDRELLAGNVIEHLGRGVTEPILLRAFEFWRNVDKALGDRIETGVRGKRADRDWFDLATGPKIDRDLAAEATAIRHRGH